MNGTNLSFSEFVHNLQNAVAALDGFIENKTKLWRVFQNDGLCDHALDAFAILLEELDPAFLFFAHRRKPR